MGLRIAGVSDPLLRELFIQPPSPAELAKTCAGPGSPTGWLGAVGLLRAIW